MNSVDIRRAASVTRIPVNVEEQRMTTATTPSADANGSRRTAGSRRRSLVDAAGIQTSPAVAPVFVGGGRRMSSTAKEPIERQMDSSMETVFRRWDAETTSVAIGDGGPPVARPHAATTSTTTGNGLLASAAAASSRTGTRERPRTRGRCDELLFDVVGGRSATVERRRRADSNNNNNSNNSALPFGDDEFGAATMRSLSESRCSKSTVNSSSPSSSWSPRIGRRADAPFRVEFDADGYQPDDVTVHVTGSRLTVHGVRRETDDADGPSAAGGLRRTTTEFCRRIRLPDDVDRDGLTCVMANGRLVVEAPRTPRPGDDVTTVVRRASDVPLNTPTVRTSVDGTVREVSLSVDVGRLFRADDVTVKVKNSTSTLTVIAERVERAPLPPSGNGSAADGESAAAAASGGGGTWRRLDAHLSWEFDLPGAIEMDTLKAGLTSDGLLKVTATMKHPQKMNNH